MRIESPPSSKGTGIGASAIGAVARMARAAYNAARPAGQENRESKPAPTQKRPNDRENHQQSQRRETSTPSTDRSRLNQKPLGEKPRFPLFQYTQFSTPDIPQNASSDVPDPSTHQHPEPIGIREAYSIYQQVETAQQANTTQPAKPPKPLAAYDSSKTPPPEKDRHFVDVEL